MRRPLPYQLQLVYNGHHKCGATLISSKHAITAGHCFWDNFGNFRDIAKFLVRSGAFYINEEGHETRRIKNILSPFPGRTDSRHILNYPYLPNPKRGEGVDLYILELESPFTLIKNLVQPACLPSKPLKYGDTCFTSGWGQTSFPKNTPATVLKIAKMKIKKPLHGFRGIYKLVELLFRTLE